MEDSERYKDLHKFVRLTYRTYGSTVNELIVLPEGIEYGSYQHPKFEGEHYWLFKFWDPRGYLGHHTIRLEDIVYITMPSPVEIRRLKDKVKEDKIRREAYNKINS